MATTAEKREIFCQATHTMRTQYTHTRSWLGNYNIGYELNNNLTCLNIMMIYYYEDINCFDIKHIIV